MSRPVQVVIPAGSVEMRLRYFKPDGSTIAVDLLIPPAAIDEAHGDANLAFYGASLSLPFFHAVIEARNGPAGSAA